ncbi:hypothetical protein GCM10009602_59900 [Nocardiopsis tropica]
MVPVALLLPQGFEAAGELVLAPALREDHVEGDRLGVPGELGNLLLFLLFLFLLDVAPVALGRSDPGAEGGLALSPGLLSQLLEFFLRQLGGGEELALPRFGVGCGFLGVRNGGTGRHLRVDPVVRERGDGERRTRDEGRRTDHRCTAQRHSVE